jgi:hypothetical protein
MRFHSPFGKTLVPLAIAAAFACGLLASRVLEKDARAQRAAMSSAVFVPADGVAFRTLDGRVIARLAYDAKGGYFELYDEHERPAASMRGNGIAVARAAPPSVPTATQAQASTGVPDLGY